MYQNIALSHKRSSHSTCNFFYFFVGKYVSNLKFSNNRFRWELKLFLLFLDICHNHCPLLVWTDHHGGSPSEINRLQHLRDHVLQSLQHFRSISRLVIAYLFLVKHLCALCYDYVTCYRVLQSLHHFRPISRLVIQFQYNGIIHTQLG